MAEPFVGIDFGTSHCSMAWFNPQAGRAELLRNAEGEEKTPSIVYFGDTETLVGTHAEQQLEDEVERQRVVISIKRELVNVPSISLRGRRVKPVEVAAAILSKLRADAADYHFHQTVTKAVITYPAAFDVLQREKILEAARLAGFTEVQMLAEPVAAALAYASEGLKVGDHVLVYDLGAGTFDLALLAREKDSFCLAMEPRGLARCGGDDFDWALYDHCDRVANELLGRPIEPNGKTDLLFLRQCRLKKEALSAHERVKWSTYLLSDSGVVLFRTQIDRTTFEGLIGERVEQTIKLTQMLVDDSIREGAGADTLVLIGGSSRVPIITKRLQSAVDLEPLRWERQDVAVALGAASHAHQLWDPLTQVRSIDKVARTTTSQLAVPVSDHIAGLRVEQLVEQARPVENLAAETEYRCEVENIAIATGGWLGPSDLQSLQEVATRVKLSQEQAARIEKMVIGKTREDAASYAKQQIYMQTVQAMWIGKQVTSARIDQLTAIATSFGLSADEAGSIERQVLGCSKEEAANAQAEYSQLVSRLKERLSLTQADAEELDNRARELNLEPSQAATIETSLLGVTKGAIIENLLQAEEKKQRRNTYIDTLLSHAIASYGWLSNDDLLHLAVTAVKLKLQGEEATGIERQLLGSTKEGAVELACIEQYRRSLQVISTWVSTQLTTAHLETLTKRAEALKLNSANAAFIEREVLGRTKEDAFDELVRRDFPGLRRVWNCPVSGNRWVSSIAWSPDGTQLAVGSHDAYIRLLDDVSQQVNDVGTLVSKSISQASRAVLGSIVYQAVLDEINAIAFSPDGQYFAAGSKKQVLQLFNTIGVERRLSGHSMAIHALAFSPNGLLLASGSEDKTILLWDPNQDKPVRTLIGHESAVYSLAFNGQILASGSSDGAICLWNVESGEMIRKISSRLGSVRSLAFHPNRQIMAGGGNGAILLWSVETGEAEGNLEGHTGMVNALSFHPGGNILASGGEDFKIRLWNVWTRREIDHIAGMHPGGITRRGCLTLAFNPIRQVLASGGCDGQVNFYVPKESGLEAGAATPSVIKSARASEHS